MPAHESKAPHADTARPRRKRRPGRATVVAAFLALASALAPALSAQTASVVEYYHLDGLGSVRAVSDAAGNLVAGESRNYLPYGEELCGTVPCSSVPAGQSRRYTGKERDAETGLDYFGARFYGAGIGRFTTIDPVYTWQDNLVDPQRWNRYAYGRDNPLRYVDPDGLAPKGKGSVARGVAKKAALELARRRGVNRAWAIQRRALEEQGEAIARTRFNPQLTVKELKELRERGRISGWYGHHINSVEAHGDVALAENPQNIRFVKGRDTHLAEHGGDFRNPTSGSFIDRAGEFLIGLIPGMAALEAGEEAVELGGAGVDELNNRINEGSWIGPNLRARREALAGTREVGGAQNPNP